MFHRPAVQAPLRGARIVVFNRELASELGLDADAGEDEWLALFNSATAPANAKPVNMAYGGHQFGNWVPQLGDGRGLLLGEVRGRDGALYDIHIKGSGTGHFSRGFDGRAVLRSSIREYLGSEALHHLGVATTRALCLIASDEPVQRERQETGALLVRTAASHVRFGTFEYFHHQGDSDSVALLANYVLARHLPELISADNPAAALLRHAIVATARTVANWQVVGFCHGVMNTDNMSILGETLDYGPYGFLDGYNPDHICNTTDSGGRYAYNRQPAIGLWNCHALALALSSLVPEARCRELLEEYEPAFVQAYAAGMGRRLGLADAGEGDLPLISGFLDLLMGGEMDFNLSFRALYEAQQRGAASELAADFADRKAFMEWLAAWLERAGAGGPDVALMRLSNPAVVLRNWHAQQAIERAEQGDESEFLALLQALRQPFELQPGSERFAQAPPEDCAGVSLSCSS